MKKLVCLMLAVLMACAMISAVAESISYGDWKLVEMRVQGASVEPATMGLSGLLTLDEDGTGQLTIDFDGEVFENTMTWTYADGVLRATGDNGEVREYVLADGTLTWSSEGGEWVFSQAEDYQIVADMPKAVDASSIDDFIGTWQLTQTFMYGGMWSADMLQMDAKVVVTSDMTSVTIGDQTYSSPSEFVDGTLKVTDANGAVSIFYLNDNGEISIETAYDETTNLTMYFARSE